MKKQIFLTFFTCWVLNSYAQSLNEVAYSKFPATVNDGAFYNQAQIEKQPISVGEARFFIDSIFRQGELKTQKSIFTSELGYRFDQVERSIEVKSGSGKQVYLDAKNVLYCKLFFDEHTVVFMPVTLPQQKELTLVQVIYKTPTLQLYRDIRKTVNRKIISVRNFDYVDEVKNDYHYYLRKNDNAPLTEVDIDAKSFSKVLPEKRNRIKSMFKEKKKEDLTVSKLVHIMGELDKSK